jgi:hypothetical protein
MGVHIDLDSPVPSRGFESGTPVPEPMHLRGHDSNHDRPLGVVLEWLSEAPSAFPRRQIAAATETKRLGNGVVQRAVVGVLRAADRALKVAEVHAGVEGRLGRSVSKDSVRSCLSSGTRGGEPSFERTAPGCYRFIHRT